MYNLGIFHNLIYISQGQKKGFLICIDDERNNTMRVQMDLRHKPSEEVKMSGIETDERLYEAVTCVCSDQAQVTKTLSINVWNRRLGHAYNKLLQGFLQHACGIESTNLVEAREFEARKLSKLRGAPRKAMADEEREAGKH